MPYFDHSATTPLHPQVRELMQAIGKEYFGNPSSIHRYGQKARSIIETARRQMANAVGCNPYEIIFTGSGTEANNLVIWNLIRHKKRHVVTSAIEHPVILTTLKNLKEFGVSSSIVPVDKNGIIKLTELEKLIQEDTALITVMYANNEVGSIQPIAEIAAVAHAHDILFHSDAVQVPGKIAIDVSSLKTDMMSFSAHKFYGPKGVGALYLKQGVTLRPVIFGGGQERKLRAGTENVVGIAGMGLAAELAARNVQSNKTLLEGLAARFKTAFSEECPEAIYNGHRDFQLPGLVSVTIPFTTSDIVLINLDMEGIAVSNGSACSSGTVEPSRVLKAMNISNDMNTRTLRISFGQDNTEDEVDLLVAAILKIISRKQGIR